MTDMSIPSESPVQSSTPWGFIPKRRSQERKGHLPQLNKPKGVRGVTMLLAAALLLASCANSSQSKTSHSETEPNYVHQAPPAEVTGDEQMPSIGSSVAE
jgi:hypothetical protein